MLVALHEMTNLPLRLDMELTIWGFAKGTDQGSLPGRLALYASHKPVQIEVLNDRQRMHHLRSVILPIVPRDRINFDPDRIIEEHEAALQKASQAGIRVTEGEITGEGLLQKLKTGKILVAIMVGNPPEQTLGLHWRLLQSYQSEIDELTVMDPAYGENFTYSGLTYLEALLREEFIGSAIVLSRKTS